MKRTGRTLTIVAMAAAMFAAAPARAASNLNFGYIDSSRIFKEYKQATEAQERFDRQVQGWRDEASEKEKLVQGLQAEVRDQGPILSSLKRQEKEEALQRAIADYERFVQDVWGPSGRAAQENTRLTAEVVERIRAVVEKIATDKGLNLVLDAAGGFMIFADRSFDLTPAVIIELNTATATQGGSQ